MAQPCHACGTTVPYGYVILFRIIFSFIGIFELSKSRYLISIISMIEDAEARGALKPGATIIEPARSGQ